MSSACFLLQRPSFSAAPRPLTAGCNTDTNGSQMSLWRPWLSSRDGPEQKCTQRNPSCPSSRPSEPGCSSSGGKPQSFHHPVRLFWPKSKSFDYLYSDGEALLRNFPVQATISFYEESDSEDEDEEDDEDEESLKQLSHFTPYN